MPDAAVRVMAMRRQFISRVRDALDAAPPEVAECAIGRMTLAGVLVELAAELLSEQVGPSLASQMLADLAQRQRAA